MGKYSFYVVLALALVWIVLTENFQWETLGIGLLVAMFCVYFSDRFLPSASTHAKTVKFSKLIFYPFYLIGQVYLAGISMMRFIITGAKVDFVPVKTTLKAEPLKIILMDSMTFVPGSISMEINDDTIMSLWIYGKNVDKDKLGYDEIGKLLKTGLEKRLLKAELPQEEEK